jgi:hypothetical protein
MVTSLPVESWSALPIREFLIFRGKYWPGRTSEPQVNRSLIFCDSECCCFGLVIIARVDDHHTGQHTHHTDIFENLVGSSVFTERQTSVRCAYFDIFMGIGHTLTDLVATRPVEKLAKVPVKGIFPAVARPAAIPTMLASGNTHLKKALGELFFKVLHLERFQQVGSEANHPGVLATGFEGGPDRIPRGLRAIRRDATSLVFVFLMLRCRR